MNFLASESARALWDLAEPAPAAPADREYRIDDLAQAAGVSVRNVRVYQDRGLLPPPRKEGRTGWYNAAHLARLDLIGRMLDRGYTFATISELLAAAQFGMRVQDVLDPGPVDHAGFADESSTTLSAGELRAYFLDDDIERNIARAIDGGLLVRDGDGYRVASRRLLDAARLLVEAGVPVADVLDQASAVRRDLVDVADRFVGLVRQRYLPGAPDAAIELDPQTIGEAAELVTKAKAMVRDVVDALLTDALDESITTVLGDIARRLSEPGTLRNSR